MRFDGSVFARLGRWLRAYSDWLAAISWGRFFLLAILFIAAVSMFTELPWFRTSEQHSAKIRYEVQVGPDGAVSITPGNEGTGRKSGGVRHSKSRKSSPDESGAESAAPQAPAPDATPAATPPAGKIAIQASPPDQGDATVHITSNGVVIDAHDADGAKKRITIGKSGVHLDPTPVEDPVAGSVEVTPPPAPQVVGTAEAAAQLAAHSADAAHLQDSLDDVVSHLEDLAKETGASSSRGAFGEFLQTSALMFVVFSIIMKIEAGRRIKVEVKAEAAEELAEAEQLKRQLVEARLQAMQAQVEPHFLFNTLASIDHLIETDPPRASAMQKNLIQYLRAALPKMRESATTLGRETDLIRAYLEILKMRMDDRLSVEFAVPDGLRSAAFPPMMLQSVVENAIKHGLEPKPEGGSIRVAAEVVDGRLCLSVADTGLGFDPGNSRTAGTGLGLTNIRERLALMHDARATLSVKPNSPAGTVVSIELPYEISRKP